MAGADELALTWEEAEPALHHVVRAFECTILSSPTSVSHLKTEGATFDPEHGPKEPSTNTNANEKEKGLAFNSGKHQQGKAISISNNHFS